MRLASRLLVLGALAPALGGCPQPSARPDRPSAQDETEIRAVLERQKDAWNRGDIHAFMAGYHRMPDIVFTSGGNVRRGWDQTLAAYEKKYVAGNAMGHLEFRDVTLQPVGADGAVALGTWELTETPQAAKGVFSLVFARVGGQWGIVHDHSSAAGS
ncbi:YybH family protein [Paraliomyxa miuraensis]|uniref:YybH family protein n=1 Tax=Paraliomyxa miuraensis TaxID=376150 RepID=UPI0022513F19|nr:nuclear transport factor 2 family protein [Paraliomyxa miuraensis]MCX4242060.1 nuclear transport factor 2 family protein [Paraliomyxa miuraensis]